MRPETTPNARPAPLIDTPAAPSPPTHRPTQRPVNKPLPTGEGATVATDAAPDDIQRWTARRRMALVLRILKGELSPEEGAQRHGLAMSEIDDWRDRMLLAGHNALRSRPRNEEAMKEEQIRRLKQKVGELVLEVDCLREALNGVRSGGDNGANDD